jgi:hypothetical protein
MPRRFSHNDSCKSKVADWKNATRIAANGKLLTGKVSEKEVFPTMMAANGKLLTGKMSEKEGFPTMIAANGKLLTGKIGEKEACNYGTKKPWEWNGKGIFFASTTHTRFVPSPRYLT